MSGPSGYIPEHELLELIEGTLPPEREAVVRAAVAREPRLGQLVARMRADRRALMSLGAVRAPAGLAERVEQALEREALLGLNGDAAATDLVLPVSQLRPRRPSIAMRLWRSPAGRGVLMAAGVALAVGTGIWVVSALSPGLPMDPVRPAPTLVAQEPGAEAEAPAADGDNAGEIEVAMAADAAADAPVLESSAPDASSVTEVATAEIHGPPAPDEWTGGETIAEVAGETPAETDDRPVMSPARALELARVGRLAIVVRGEDPEAAAAGVEALARASARAGVWRRVDSGATLAPGFESVAALWGSDIGLPQLPLAPGWRQWPAIAKSNPEDQGPLWAAPLGIGLQLPAGIGQPRPELAAPPRAVWSVSIEDKESTLASLLAALGRRSAGERAEFVELPVPIDAPPPVDADTVLWWTQPASAWGWRISVPVIVEGRR